MLPSLTTALLLPVPPPSSLFLPSRNPKPSTLPLKNPKPDINANRNTLSLEITRERKEIVHVSHAKSRNFNTEVVVGEDDDPEECLNRFNAQIQRMGLLREINRRRFHENPLEKRKRKAREAWFRRRKRHYKRRDSTEDNKETPSEIDSLMDDFWAAENLDELLEDEEQEKKDMQVFLKEDGHGNWALFDKISHI